MNIGFNIKKLRRESDITQEQLAEYLNISVSAISQWESGKTTPDISLLAPLANLFDVSADVILGIDIINKEKQIQDIISQANNCIWTMDWEKAVSMLREGLEEYPNSFEIMERLMCHIRNSTLAKPTDETLVLSNEIIKLGEKLLAECTDDRLRLYATSSLCHAYKTANMPEKAIELAEKLPPAISVNREHLLANLYHGEKKIKQIKENMLNHFEQLIINMENYIGAENNVIIRKKAIILIETMMEDENYGYFWEFMFSSYLKMAKDYVKELDYDKAIECLQLSSLNVIKLDTDYGGANHVYTSLLLKGTQARISANNSEGFSRALLGEMKNTSFDPIREKAEFIEIEEKLKICKNK